jgi:hypothetical protein
MLTLLLRGLTESMLRRFAEVDFCTLGSEPAGVNAPRFESVIDNADGVSALRMRLTVVVLLVADSVLEVDVAGISGSTKAAASGGMNMREAHW